jgi:hypothetical protein
VFQRHFADPPVWLNGHPRLLNHPMNFAAPKRSSPKGNTV